jgi:trehalose 6-phosphate phosphatase
MTRSGGAPRTARRARTEQILPAPASDWAYFFDIDGTLVDISASPFGVRVERDLYRLVAALYRATGGAVALISGRAIADIVRMFPDVRMPVEGHHGVERRDAAGRISHHAFPASRLDDVRRTLTQAVARHPGLMLEDKGLSLALHYRNAPKMGGYAHRLLRSMHVLMGSDYSLLAGKRVVEMKPAGRDKGEAVLEFMQEEPFRGRVPTFIGDDITDEYGFAVVNRLHGYSVKVGSGSTVARWRLPSVRAVQRWLEQSRFPTVQDTDKQVTGLP